jgi:hypothetical protein
MSFVLFWKMAVGRLGRHLQAVLADLNADRFKVHSEPIPDGYRKTARYARGEQAESASLPDLTFDADEVLPPNALEAGAPNTTTAL